ncbi:hypothetical protein LXL04_006860 [Taraxacum kok-saghyz]
MNVEMIKLSDSAYSSIVNGGWRRLCNGEGTASTNVLGGEDVGFVLRKVKELVILIYNMSNIAKLEFPALEVTGKNYMPWTIDVEMHLESMVIRDTINFINDCSLQVKERAHIFLRKHIDEMLRIEHLNVSDPNVLWTRLKE